ncbi:protein zyg-11 homolog [Tachysurus fulvidraco]|uniref:protein zyg-11 homolog n=1 Tax=Tachysurus fulvidraco TaxID=1234273 RepID=UPI001FF0218E|nr:protein zyg-11 homolog [Tachysurus fulvidraco]
MDEDSPPSLVNVCLLSVCQSLDTLCSVCDDGSLRLRSCPIFPPELSDLLLSTMTDEGLLNEKTLGIFHNVECFRLKRACIRGTRLTAASFRRSLCSHCLQELDASHVLGDITVSDIVQGLSLNRVCCQSLHRLSVSAVDCLLDVPVSFRKLQGLRSLSVAWTPLDDSTLEDICSLPLLESLDISGTNITDLMPLLKLRSRLRSLTLHALHHLTMAADDFLAVISALELLTHLDVSNDLIQTRGEMIRKLLQKTHILPALLDLDVSGWKGISDEALKTFLEGHTRMRFIGLLATGAGRSDLLSGDGNLKVAGDWNLLQLCEALRRYRGRESFVQEALLCLYKLLGDADVGCRPDVLGLVYLGMKAHSKCVSVQVSGSACVFNLTILELAEGMSQRLLGNVMRHIITTMRTFPDHKQIQKNCLLSLCSNYILDVVPFNRCEAAKQVMMCFISNEDETLQSLCASVIVVLMSKLSQEEIVELGTEKIIMKRLLHLVQQRASMGLLDNILEGTLTALWGLTDDANTACTHFLQCEGLELYKELMETYYSNPRVLKIVLGLLTNVSEMEDLHAQLMDEELLQLLLVLMEKKEVEVSYLAGGFLANITSSGVWSLDSALQHEILTKLHSAVMSWTPPEHSIISYRSLRPLYLLMGVSQPSAVQLWALWGIRHICTHKVSHYRRMLEEEGGLDVLRTLTSDPNTHSDVHSFATDTLHLVEGQSLTHTST